MNRELGDWQTPERFAQAVVSCLVREGIQASRVLEPTCGEGAFIKAALPLDAQIIGLELQDRHVATAQARYGAERDVKIEQCNAFSLLLSRIEWQRQGPLLILGNPPWVTNSELGRTSSNNVPAKSNLKGLSGIDAISGASNFDIAEYVVLKCLSETAAEDPTLAMLVKTSVARRVLEFAFSHDWPVAKAVIRKFDAKLVFGASVDACLLMVNIDRSRQPTYRVPVYASLEATEPDSVIGLNDKGLIANVHKYRPVVEADGRCQIEWRQGVKHDAARVMELSAHGDNSHTNGFGETVEIEPEFVYPMMKCTDLARGRDPQRFVIITQRRPIDDTRRLKVSAPRLWRYLQRHTDTFAARRSSIYRKRPEFSMFGVGDYSFTDWKIAVSGLHKVPRFRLIGPHGQRPVILDDACYLLACGSEQQARLIHSLLTTPSCEQLLASLVFSDAKRPITKRLLQRLDLRALLNIAAGYTQPVGGLEATLLCTNDQPELSFA
ncbi:class I SAM-dependent methyltransferase [Candidatus Poriferisodalis sp.]|uniref:class I SAM-dependent methyltransferase n=1 Tax=Candidatus Poriferisodalis sp. TaxID=3101277 RepID=UPI003B02B2C4